MFDGREAFLWSAPDDVGVSLEPGELFLGIDTRVFLYALDGCVAVHSAIKIGEHLLVAYGIKRIQMAQWVDMTCLLLKSCINHLVDAPVDAFKELLTLNIEANLDDVERPLLGFAGAQ